MSHSKSSGGAGHRQKLFLIGVLGIVYGDIGTSPLYALRECFASEHGLPVGYASVIGLLSLITWSLIVVVSVNYLLIVMRADNNGEGGILSLVALLGKTDAPRGKGGILLVGVAGAAMLCADAIITPAISILSAVEGIELQHRALAPWVIPISLGIVLGLFIFQSHGTGKIARWFGPVMLVWFATLGVVGVSWIVRAPSVLWALSPMHALHFSLAHPVGTFAVLGTLFLVVTGAEALYADMGHFNRRSIRWGWFTVVMPCLLANYFGQGARLIQTGNVGKNLFFDMVPDWAVIPMVALATFATIIASQAVITGMFSLVSQAIQMGLCPRMVVHSTSDETRGQIYVPMANFALCAGCIVLILEWKTSGALAAAYGLSVSMTMLATAILLMLVAKHLWKWSRKKRLLLAPLFFIPFPLFFLSNLLKIPAGGWLTIGIGSVIFLLADIWRWGRLRLRDRLSDGMIPCVDFALDAAKATVPRAAGTAVYLTSSPEMVPRPLLHNFKHNQILHKTNVFVTVLVDSAPLVPPRRRAELDDLGGGFFRVRLRYGYRQTPDIPHALTLVANEKVSFKPMKTTYFLGRISLVIPTEGRIWTRWRARLFELMFRNSLDPARFFQLPPNRVVELGEQVRL